MDNSKALDCGICYCPYDTDENEPMELGCGHSLCKVCLSKLLTGTSNKVCPECRSKLKALHIGGFKPNYGLKGALELLKKGSESCRCGVHNSFYCGKCDKFICKKCVDLHFGHPLKPFDPESDLTKSSGEENIKRLSSYSKQLGEGIVAFEMSFEVLQTKAVDDHKKIDRFFGKLDNILKKLKSDMNEEVDSILLSGLNYLEDVKSQLQSRKDNVDNLVLNLRTIFDKVRDPKHIMSIEEKREFESISNSVLAEEKKIRSLPTINCVITHSQVVIESKIAKHVLFQAVRNVLKVQAAKGSLSSIQNAPIKGRERLNTEHQPKMATFGQNHPFL